MYGRYALIFLLRIMLLQTIDFLMIKDKKMKLCISEEKYSQVSTMRNFIVFFYAKMLVVSEIA